MQCKKLANPLYVPRALKVVKKSQIVHNDASCLITFHPSIRFFSNLAQMWR